MLLDLIRIYLVFYTLLLRPFIYKEGKEVKLLRPIELNNREENRERYKVKIII
jgi:hypothetical protein